MKKIYIIPGWEDLCSQDSYQALGKVAKEKGYEVLYKDVDWKKPLSNQIFEVSENAVIFGFSLGAILAWMVAQKNKCNHLILASMTPHYSFEKQEIKEALIEITGKEFVDDVIKNLKKEHLAQKQTIMYGDKEDESANIIILNTDHEITNAYIKEIGKIL